MAMAKGAQCAIPNTITIIQGLSQVFYLSIAYSGSCFSEITCDDRWQRKRKQAIQNEERVLLAGHGAGIV